MRLITRLPLAFVCLALLEGQNKKPPTPADYGQWETLIFGGRQPGKLSPDGKWLACGVNRSNGNNELRLARTDSDLTKTVAFGLQPAFSADSRWVAYAIGRSEAQEEKLRKDKKPIHNKLGLTNLATGEQSEIEGIETFAFSPSGTWLAMRRYAPEKPPTPPGGSGSGDAAKPAEDENPVGATLIVRNLATGRDIALGDASEYVWQDFHLKGHLLAFAISSPDKTGNGIQVFDTATGTLRVLDSSNENYSGLAWRKDAADLAALRSKADDKYEGENQVLLAWNHLGETDERAHQFDPGTGTQIGAGMRIVPYRKPAWSRDGSDVFFGIAKWYEKPPKAKDAPKDGAKDSAKENAKDADDKPAVDVWHWKDPEVLPKQKKGVEQQRHRNLLAVWHVDSGLIVPLGRDLMGQVTPLKNQQTAYATEWKQYALDRSIGRPAADLSLVDLQTGKQTLIKDDLLNDNYYLVASPGGKYLLYLQDDDYWTVNVATHAVVNITKGVKTSFIDRESDYTVKQLPPFGVAGWTKDDKDVILYDKFDLWRIAPDGSRPVRLTDGAAGQIRYRYVQLDPDEEFIDPGKPLYLHAFGIYSKKSGYARVGLNDAAPKAERLLWEDQDIDQLAKAKDAPVFAYVTQTFEESPSLLAGGPELTGAKRIVATNTFQSNFAWSHSELIEYKSPQGRRLQASLYYPDDYEAGKKYPMIVYLYERLSDGLHHYSSLSERQYYNPSAITSHGYFVLMPDIVFRPREPGLSVAECVTAALKETLAKGLVNEKKIGVMGHSWGGFDTAFLTTHTTLFAAGVAGAPITDLVSNYGNHHWSSGIAETDHIETGQQRMQVPLYEDLPAYIRNSAVFNVQNMTTPLLIEVGDSDGTVFFHQGVELYNIARRARKNVVLLEYAGEDHGLRKKANQMDYQRRIFAWFGHYLKDEPAADWITNGESYLDQQRHR